MVTKEELCKKKVTLKSAAVVREEQKNRASEEEEKFLEKIANAIDIESNRNRNAILISIPRHLFANIAARLQSLGYVVTDSSNQMDGESITIEW